MIALREGGKVGREGHGMMKILLTGFVNAFSEVGLMIKKPSLKLRERLLEMIRQGVVKDMAVGGKNKMFLIV